MNITLEDSTTEQLNVEWDCQSIDTLVDILRKKPVHESVLRDEHPVPQHVKKDFPSVLAMDSHGQCLLSLVDFTIEVLAVLYDKQKMDKINRKHLYFGHPSPKRKLIDDHLFVVGFLIKEMRFAYIDFLEDTTYVLYSSKDMPYSALPAEDQETSWMALSSDGSVLKGSSASLKKASRESQLELAAQLFN